MFLLRTNKKPPKNHRPPSTSPPCDVIAPSCRAWPPSGAWSSHPRTQLRLSLDTVKTEKMRFQQNGKSSSHHRFWTVVIYSLGGNVCHNSSPRTTTKMRYMDINEEASEIFRVDAWKNKIKFTDLKCFSLHGIWVPLTNSGRSWHVCYR